MGNVQARPGEFCQQYPTLDTEGFRSAGNPAQPEGRGLKALVCDAIALQRRVFAVLNQRYVEHAGVLERPAHQQRRRHRMPVVADRHTPRLPQLRNVGQQLAFGSLGYGTDWIDAGQVGFRGFGQDQRRDIRVVVHRRRVRHTRDRREPSSDGGRCTSGNGLLVFLPGLAQMHVHVDQPRADDQPRWNLDDGRAIDWNVAADPCDTPVFNQHVIGAVDAVAWVDHAAAFKQLLHGPLRRRADTARPSAPRLRSPPGRE